jgi:hypothetical protein
VDDPGLVCHIDRIGCLRHQVRGDHEYARARLSDVAAVIAVYFRRATR